MERPLSHCVCAIVMAMVFVTVNSQGWDSAHATFYGDMGGADLMHGACGYGDLNQRGYGLDITALSTPLFNNGSTCGACYELQCTNATVCKPNAGSIQVTATDLCPPGSQGGWCDLPKKHFDLSMPAFTKLADAVIGVIPVNFRRVPCVKQGGIKFEINGNPNFILMLVYNVAGDGDVVDVKVKAPDTDWIQMTRNYGQNWQTSVQLVGKSLSFQVSTSDGKMVESDNVAPANWQFGKTFEGKNF